jgi:hypothetical protein
MAGWVHGVSEAVPNRLGDNYPDCDSYCRWLDWLAPIAKANLALASRRRENLSLITWTVPART